METHGNREPHMKRCNIRTRARKSHMGYINGDSMKKKTIRTHKLLKRGRRFYVLVLKRVEIVWCDNNVLLPHFPHNVRFVTRFPNNGKLNNAHSQLISLDTLAALRLWGFVLFRSLSPITDGFYGVRWLKFAIFDWKRSIDNGDIYIFDI